MELQWPPFCSPRSFPQVSGFSPLSTQCARNLLQSAAASLYLLQASLARLPPFAMQSPCLPAKTRSSPWNIATIPPIRRTHSSMPPTIRHSPAHFRARSPRNGILRAGSSQHARAQAPSCFVWSSTPPVAASSPSSLSPGPRNQSAEVRPAYRYIPEGRDAPQASTII